MEKQILISFKEYNELLKEIEQYKNLIDECLYGKNVVLLKIYSSNYDKYCIPEIICKGNAVDKKIIDTYKLYKEQYEIESKKNELLKIEHANQIKSLEDKIRQLEKGNNKKKFWF